MSTTSLNSTFLREASFDSNTNTLTVIFTDGRTYTYQGVDQSVYQGLISADSSSRFFGSNIRGRFSTTNS
jgi:hypothetical protein